MANRGVFITFEGMDGCGKTTQMRRLAKRLRRVGILKATDCGTGIPACVLAFVLRTQEHRQECVCYVGQ